MAKTSFHPAAGSQRAVILVVALGLVLMLASTLWQRLDNPHLVKEIGPRGETGQSGGGGMGGMNPELGKLMQQVSENPNDFKTLVHLSEHLVNDQQWDAAETFAQRAMTVNPGDAQPAYLLGVILHNKGRHQEAAEALETVVKLKDEASVRYSLGVLYIHYLGNTPKGVEHLSAGLHDPKAPEALKAQMREELEKAPLTDEKHKASSAQPAPAAPAGAGGDKQAPAKR